MAETWTGTTWFVEGDIADCFGSLDHETLVKILAEKIHDNRFLRLIQQMLQAGYLEDWVWNATLRSRNEVTYPSARPIVQFQSPWNSCLLIGIATFCCFVSLIFVGYSLRSRSARTVSPVVVAVLAMRLTMVW